jgi:phage terminase small subunit
MADSTSTPESVDPALSKPLTKRQRRFVKEYLVDLNGTKAAIRAGYFGTDPGNRAWKWKKRPHIAAAIAKGLEELDHHADEEALRARLIVRAQAFADPNEIMEFRREACRFCYGVNHRHQFTPREMETRRADYERRQLEEAKKPDPAPIAPLDEQGGIGFDPHRRPHPECPECHGDGTERVYFHDTRTLSPEARALYAGVKTTEKGIEVRTNPQHQARELYLKLTGQLKDRLELTGKDGAPIEIVDTRERNLGLIEQLAKRVAGGTTGETAAGGAPEVHPANEPAGSGAVSDGLEGLVGEAKPTPTQD